MLSRNEFGTGCSSRAERIKQQQLDELEREEIISYAESGLADGHQYRDWEL